MIKRILPLKKALAINWLMNIIMNNWQIIRQQVLERDNYTCRECGQPIQRLDVHHKIPRRKGGLDILENLISLCRKCHKIVEPTTKMGYSTKVTSGYMLKVKLKTHKRLKKFGKFGDSFEDILNRLMDIAEEKTKK
jgi:HNH endonuclease